MHRAEPDKHRLRLLSTPRHLVAARRRRKAQAHLHRAAPDSSPTLERRERVVELGVDGVTRFYEGLRGKR